MSYSLWHRGLQHTRLPCPSLSPGVCSTWRPLSRWCHPTISSSVVPFSCHQSFPESGSFPMSQLFASGGQSIGVSVSASVLPMNIQGWFPLGWTGLISLQSKGLSRVFSNTTVQKHQFFISQSCLSNSHIHTPWICGDISQTKYEAQCLHQTFCPLFNSNFKAFKIFQKLENEKALHNSFYKAIMMTLIKEK